MEFSMINKLLMCDTEEIFTEETAPAWLTSKDTIIGSTMDYRWFWENHVLTLEVGQLVHTDFRIITRIS